MLIKIGIILAILAALIFGAIYMVDSFLSSRRESIFTLYPELSRTQVNLVLNGEVIIAPTQPIIQDDNIFLPVDFINEHISLYTFWDGEENVIITTETQVRRYRIGQLEYTNNGEPRLLSEPFIERNGIMFVPQNFAQSEYNVIIDYHPEHMIITIDDAAVTRTHARLTADGKLRTRPERHAHYMEEVSSGDSVLLLEEANGFWRVRSANAIEGYVQSRLIGERTVVSAVIPEPEQPLNRKQPLEYPIVLLWDVLFANRDFWDVSDEVTIISPKWFEFQTEPVIDGTIIDLGNRAYVDFAHANGRMVWPMLTDNFSSAVSHAVLTDTETRQFVIEQILELIVRYNLDGINVDYEAVRADFSPYFIQFLRELRPPMHELGAHLSVALFVPRYTMFMNRTEIAKTVDYIAVMTYDEHWRGSPEPGPVASLPFVEEGIALTMNEAPSEMIIMGLPFYVRIWRETTHADGSRSHTIRDVSMNLARSIFIEGGATFTWLDHIGSYYAEFPSADYPNVIYRVWLECERSISHKLNIARDYNLAGVAGWRGWLENPATWDVIADYVEQMR